MGKLAEYVRTEARRLKAEFDKQAEAVAEWKTAVRDLYKILKQWVAEADGGHGLLSVGDGKTRWINDPGLGVYEAEILTISLGSRTAEIVPRARFVVEDIRLPDGHMQRADGCVEILDSGIASVLLFRVKGGGDLWFIRPARVWNKDHGFDSAAVLDRERFEAVLVGILR